MARDDYYTPGGQIYQTARNAPGGFLLGDYGYDYQGAMKPYPGAEGTQTYTWPWSTREGMQNPFSTGGSTTNASGDPVVIPQPAQFSPTTNNERPSSMSFMPTFINPGPKWKQRANKEWGQGMSALAAYDALYEPTLAMAQRSARDYGNLYRQASNESSLHNLYWTGATREADVQDYLRMGPQLLAGRRAADPLFGKTYDLAQEDLDEVDADLPANVRRDIAENVRGSQVRRGMGLGGSDAFEEALQMTMAGEDFRNNRRDRAFRQAGNLLGIYGDPFQSLTGRSARSVAPQGAEVMAPYAGFDTSTLLSYGVNNEMQQANLDAAKRGQDKALTGAVIGAFGSIAGAGIKACWVAREVYGEDNPRWLQFRRWMVCRAPLALLRRYMRHGQEFAGWLRTHPEHKPRVRAWMEAKLSTV